ncbi:MAG: penicillin-binding protein 2 [Patescibacteria group bacterium]|jgi:cell division protein FtsI/penicillin-binding protein 2
MNIGRNNQEQTIASRINVLQGIIFLFVLIIIGRLFYLQIIKHDYYVQLGLNQRTVDEEVIPERGRIFALASQSEDGELYPLAVNKVFYEVALDPKMITRPQNIADILAKNLEIDVNVIKEKANLTDKRYEVIAKNVSEDKVDRIKDELNILLDDVNKGLSGSKKLIAIQDLGISLKKSVLRFYPDKEVGAHILGFLGFNEDGISREGKYGLEGYLNNELSGLSGKIVGEQDQKGVLLADSQGEQARPGVDVVLTIDHTVQYKACQALQKAVEKNMADSGTVIVMETATGAIRAMCDYPSFDPNDYGKVDSPEVYNNLAVFQNYEPGSVMKAISMAIAINEGKVTPETSYEDTGEVKFAFGQVIRNAGKKEYGWSDMKKVLAYSINTGIIFATQDVPNKIFHDYMSNFGFGKTSNILLSQESEGDISSLEKKGDIYKATASYGQGITVTPLQMINAFNVLANRGNLMQPYVIKELRYNDQVIESYQPKIIRQNVISASTASQISAMLVNVVDSEHAVGARVSGYYVAGKSGTAQVANIGAKKYDSTVTIHSFIGFAPASKPKFTLLTKLDNPKTAQYSEGTAIPLFGEIAQFLIQYYKIAPER